MDDTGVIALNTLALVLVTPALIVSTTTAIPLSPDPGVRVAIYGGPGDRVVFDNAISISQKNSSGVVQNLIMRSSSNVVNIDNPDALIRTRTGASLENRVDINNAGGMVLYGAGNGILMKSPDGLVCAKVSIGNDGKIKPEITTCP